MKLFSIYICSLFIFGCFCLAEKPNFILIFTDDQKFKSYYAAKSYLRTLKKQEDGWKSLDISKVSPYRYETKWVYDTEDHGLFCVCPDCRLPKTKEVTKVGYLSRP